MSNKVQARVTMNDSSINFEEVDHKEIILFEISSSLESLKEDIPEDNKNSLVLINDIQRILDQLNVKLFPDNFDEKWQNCFIS